MPGGGKLCAMLGLALCSARFFMLSSRLSCVTRDRPCSSDGTLVKNCSIMVPGMWESLYPYSTTMQPPPTGKNSQR